MDAPDPNSTPIRSKIWMPYGDIILQAESTQFRVNRDVLAQQSSVFRDMFSVPQSADEPMIEGCPIVQVFDQAKDWALLLETLYNPFNAEKTPEFVVIAAMLRLGRKYDMPKAKNTALSGVHQEFPDSLSSLDMSASEFLCSTVMEFGELVDFVNLVYECGVRTSIPTAALWCLDSNLLESLMMDQTLRTDGSRAVLPTTIKLTLAVAADRISIYQQRLFEWLVNDSVIPDFTCATRAECSKYRQHIYHIAITGWKGVRYCALSTWDDGNWSKGLCSICDEVGRAAFDSRRAKTWKLLPGFFGLPDWKDLKDLD